MVRWRWPVLVASLALVGALGYAARTQRYYNPSEIWFLATDPALVSYRQLTRQYGQHDFVIVAFRDPAGIFTNKALAAIFDLTERLEQAAVAERVSSVASYQHVRAAPGRDGGGEGEDDEELVVGDLVAREELPLPAEELARRQVIALGERPVLGSLLGAPERPGEPPTTAAVVVRVPVKDQDPDHPVRVVEAILAAARDVEAATGYRFYVAGVPVVEHAYATFGKRETVTYVSVLLVTVATLLALIFRRAYGVVVPCGVVALSIVGGLGTMALLGIWLNPLTTIMPQILITVGIAAAVHVVSGFAGHRRRGMTREAAVAQAVEDNFRPCLVTSVTTAIGFASLVVATVVPMRELGVAASLGVLLAWAMTFTFLPALLAIWPASAAPPAREARGGLAMDRLLAGAARLATRRPWTVIAGVVLVLGAIAAFAVMIRVETSYPNMFKRQTVLRQGIAFIEANLGGSVDIELSIDSGRPDGVKDPRFLAGLEDVQQFLARQPEVSHTFSIADVLARMDGVMRGAGPAGDRLPDSAEASAQYLLLYALGSPRDDLKDRIDVDNRWTLLSARAQLYSSSETLAFAERVRQFLRERHPELRVNVTGRALLYSAMQEDLAANTVRAFATAFVPITLVQAALFRSLKVGALTMLPNLLPILAVFGLMGLLGIPLDPGSALVASVAIGVVVDDTVHFFSRYLDSRGAGASPAEAVERTLREVGRPVIYTTAILALGFSLFSFSQFTFIAYFGQLAACAMVLALGADLLMTPALMVTCDTARRPLTRALRRTGPPPAGAPGIEAD